MHLQEAINVAYGLLLHHIGLENSGENGQGQSAEECRAAAV